MKHHTRVVAMVLLLCSIARANTPTTQPVEPPEKVMPQLMQAILTGDVAGVRSRSHAEGEQAREALDAVIACTEAAAELQDAVVEQLGEKVSQEIKASEFIPAAAFQPTSVSIEDDRATITVGPNKTPLRLRDGRWQFNLDEHLRSNEMGMTHEQQIAHYHESASRLRAVAERVRSGELTTAPQVVEAVQNSVFRTASTVDKVEVH